MDINNNDINGLILNNNNLNTVPNKNYINNVINFPNQRFNTEFIYNSPMNIKNNQNINSKEEFTELIEKISTLLKDYFNNDNLYFKNIKLISESINEQTLFGRCSINDIYLYLNQITYPRYNGVLANMNEKYIKEKLNLINNRLNKIEELKDNMNQNIKSTEIELITFYEESKNILQKLKIYYKYGKVYTEKEIQKLEELNILKTKYNILLKENSRLKVNLKINNSLQNRLNINNNSLTKNRNNKINIGIGNRQRNYSYSKPSTKKYNMSASYSKKKKAAKINIHSLKKEYNNIGSTKIKTKENISINIIVDLADMILKFLNDMKNLQEYIIKKNIGLQDLKKKFETSKKNLRIFCEKIINNKNSPEKIKNINLKNMNYIHPYKSNKSKEKNFFETKINKLETILIEKNNKIKNLENDISLYIDKNNKLIKQNNELNTKIKSYNNNDLNLVNMNLFKEKQNKFLIELEEKNAIIKDLNIKLKEQINKNNELLQIKEENIKLKKQLNNCNIDKKIYSDIRNILNTINENSKKNLDELINKDKQFDLDIQKANNININKINENLEENKDDKEILDNLNNYKNITNEYGDLLGQIKNYNNIFEQINKNNI